ncbi:hypothetical protein [Hymenobacter sp. PAMC 26628]|uniref:hypothetical protein n=1 Tax=Hymenobacter sp. PAMC 26628 TaxID=1484118 RepID=UPI0012FFC502|nr:hypothetical protein [Hymenobacter sp. PAMC 26628]
MENNDKIEDNSSFKDLRKIIEGFDALKGLVNLFDTLGINNEELSQSFEGLEKLKSQFDILSESPDKFNSFFAKKGWIAHESMNQDLILRCIEFAESNQPDIGEENLIEYYSSNQIYWLVSRLQGISAFRKRYPLLKLAYQDTLEGRFHSAVPIILMMMDGVVSDINSNEGFFADKSDLTAWDSIAAHSTGLMVLRDILSASRKKTSEETILMPFRNGILHGRDLGYANRTVVAKSWAALFAVNDWARSIEDGKKQAPPVKPEPTLKEQLESLISSVNSLEKSKEANKKLESWKARNLIIGVDVPEKGKSEDYAISTPEQEAIRFAEYWQGKRYDLIAKQVHYHFVKNINYKKETGKARAALEKNTLVNYKISKITDCTPAISEVALLVTIERNGNIHELPILLRLIYQNLDGNILVFGEPDGRWLFVESFFHTLEYLD